jgi:hypothetical protein
VSPNRLRCCAAVAALASIGQAAGVEPFVGLLLGAGFIGLWFFAARQVARGRRGFAWVFFAPVLFGLISVVWIAVQSWVNRPLTAIALLVVAVPSLLLFIRMARQQASEVLPSDPTWTLSSAHFDYIVWMAIGLPFIAILGLIILLIADAVGAFS